MDSMIPLAAVAPDQRDLVAAFRDAGGKSFQDAGSVDEARATYEASCATNGLDADPLASVRNVMVGEGDEAFGLRVYDPREGRSGERSPVIVFVHGGGWVIGSLETHDTICRRLATSTGLPVVAVDYRLGPEHRFPAAHLDGQRAVAWIRDEAEAEGWDPHRLVTTGDSAGGGLATTLASSDRLRVEGTTVIAQVLLYPALDMANESAGYRRINQGFSLTADGMRWFAQNFFADPADAHDPLASPLPALRESRTPQPPAFIVSLGLDPLGDEALEYATELAKAGTHVELIHLPGHAHGIFTSAGRIETARRVLLRAADFIREQSGTVSSKEVEA